MSNRSATWLATLHILGDLVLTVAALAMADSLRLRLDLGRDVAGLGPFVQPLLLLIVCGVWLGTFSLLRVYDTQRVVSLANQLQTLLLAVPVATFVFAGALYFSFREIPRLMVAYFFVADLMLLTAFRLSLALVFAVMRRRGYLVRRVLIVGYNDLGRDIANIIDRRRWMNHEVIGFVDPSGVRAFPGDRPVLGTLDVVPAVIRKHAIEDVIIALPGEERGLVPQLALDLLTQPVRVKVVPDLHSQIAVRASAEDLWGIPLIGLREPVITGFAWGFKRAFDILASAIVLVLLAPLFGAIALLIRWRSPGGPIIFRQLRVGENGRLFPMYKFRTMRPDAESLADGLGAPGEDGQVVYKHRADPRVTRIGRFLRRYSLDELPQLWNVFRGEMSLVGPRPEQLFLVERYAPWQRKRLAVLPGITGWWQVNGRSDLPMHLNSEYDLYYIQNYSFFLDLRILWKTLGVVLRGSGAY
jgi:exopolysaccharide biosynthesis polyprenyl glycosylphosphotransferase